MSSRLGRCLIFSMVVLCAMRATANSVVISDFSSATLHSELLDSDGAFSIGGGNISRTSSPTGRHYIRTTDTDYFASPDDFQYELTFNNPNGAIIQFIGLGTGVPYAGGPFPGEPQLSLNLRIHGPSVVSGRVDLGFDGPPVGGYQGIGNVTTNGPHRARIFSTGDLLTFQIDTDYTGVFGADISTSIDLSNFTYAGIKNTLNNESRMFFGTADTIVDYDDISIVPEPNTLALAAVSVMGIVGFARRRRK
jgi:hypothetical protein